MFQLRLTKRCIFAFILTAAFLPAQAAAFTLFPGEGGSDYRQFIVSFYSFALPAAALVGVALIMIAGVIWVTSAGSQQRIATAKEYILNAIIGMVLLMGAYVILGFINPNLVLLSLPSMKDVGEFGSCTFGSADNRNCIVSSKQTCQKDYQGTFLKGTDCSKATACESLVFEAATPSTCGRDCLRRSKNPNCNRKSFTNGICHCHIGAPSALTGEQQQQQAESAERVRQAIQDPAVRAEIACAGQSGSVTAPRAITFSTDVDAQCRLLCRQAGPNCGMNTVTCTEHDSIAFGPGEGKCIRADCSCVYTP